MIRMLRMCLPLCAMLLAGAARAAEAPRVGEGLEIAPPPGWKAIDRRSDGRMDEVYLVPPGQERDWRDLIVYREIKGLTGVPPRRVLEDSIEQARTGCPNVEARPIQEGNVNGYPGAFLMVICPGGGKVAGEISLVKVVGGKSNLYMIQRTWRMPGFDPAKPPVDSKTIDTWVRYLSAQKPCDTRDPRHPCAQPDAR